MPAIATTVPCGFHRIAVHRICVSISTGWSSASCLGHERESSCVSTIVLFLTINALIGSSFASDDVIAAVEKICIKKFSRHPAMRSRELRPLKRRCSRVEELLQYCTRGLVTNTKNYLSSCMRPLVKAQHSEGMCGRSRALSHLGESNRQIISYASQALLVAMFGTHYVVGVR